MCGRMCVLGSGGCWFLNVCGLQISVSWFWLLYCVVSIFAGCFWSRTCEFRLLGLCVELCRSKLFGKLYVDSGENCCRFWGRNCVLRPLVWLCVDCLLYNRFRCLGFVKEQQNCLGLGRNKLCRWVWCLWQAVWIWIGLFFLDLPNKMKINK